MATAGPCTGMFAVPSSAGYWPSRLDSSPLAHLTTRDYTTDEVSSKIEIKKGQDHERLIGPITCAVTHQFVSTILEKVGDLMWLQALYPRRLSTYSQWNYVYDVYY